MGRAPFRAKCGTAPARLATRTNQRQREWCSNGAKHKAATLSWKRESDEVAAVMAEAEEDGKAKDPTSMDHQPPSLESGAFLPRTSVGQKEMVKLEKRMRNNVLDKPVILQNLDTSFSGKRLKDSCWKSVMDQVEKDSGTETMWEDGEHEDNFLSPAESNASHRRTNYKGEHAKPPIGKEKKLERQSSLEFDKECRNTLEPQQIKIPRVRFSDFERTESKCRDRQERGSKIKFSAQNHKDINWEIVQNDHFHRQKVMEALNLFEEEYVKLLMENLSDSSKGNILKAPHYEAAQRVKDKGKNILPDKPFGHIPGVEIGDEFSFRAELAIVGLHCQSTAGIDFVKLNGKPYATSVVNSGRYENESKGHDILIYSGEGGNAGISVRTAAADQKPLRGNLAMINSFEMRYPLRLVLKRKRSVGSKTLDVNAKRDYIYVYDGLYVINRFWRSRENKNGKLVFKFELHRLPEQLRTNVELGKQIRVMEMFTALQGKEKHKVVNGVQKQQRSQSADICVMDDVSLGKEKYKVRVVNGLDGGRPPPFTYITDILNPPHWDQPHEPTGCNCIDGCSNSVQCLCLIKNGGTIPYTEKGELLTAMTNNLVHECGPSCKCPPSCMNRVSQRGPRFKLEIFKTKSMGWGVRSRDYIKSGSFICEYIGEVVGEEEASQRTCKDEYLFDICHGKSKSGGFSLDAAKCGNVARFFNHSCEPNMFVQEVLYDHEDKRIPHIMFFAGKHILPKKELTYKYSVRDVKGDIKRKACNCGSATCTGRLQ